MLIDSAALNRLSVLKAIRRSAPISRVELAQKLGLSKATISEITAELIEANLAQEGDSTARERGRPRVQLSLRPQALAVAGANLQPDGILDLCVVDLAGNLLERGKAPMMTLATIEALVEWIAGSLDNFIARAPIDRARIASAAITLPGVIESSTGTLLWLPMLEGENIPAARTMSERLGLPVIIENDIDCLARAEHWFGDDAASGDITIVYQGMSIGLAQYTAGLPRSGIAGANAEFAHVKTETGNDARPCFCGGRGCLTSYSSDLGLLLSYSGSSGELLPQIQDMTARMPTIIAAAAAGEPDAQAAFRVAGHHLGLALANYINVLDPRSILVRTADSRVSDLIREGVETALGEFTLPVLARRTVVKIGCLAADWRWKGTAALALEQAYLGKAVRQSRDTVGNMAGN